MLTIMKKTHYLPALLICLLSSCSPYQRVSLTGFKNYNISSDKREDLQYVLKKQRLHYWDTDTRYQVHNYDGNSTNPYESHQIHLHDHIVIPKGAVGVCIHSVDDHLLIDFGEGVLVPFLVLKEDNRANNTIRADERVYYLEASNRKARLYFDTRGAPNDSSNN
jgi:hypothetical protein